MHAWRTIGFSILVAFSATFGAAEAKEKYARFHTVDEASESVIDHAAWTTFLSTYVTATSDGRTVVRYADVKESDHLALKAYIEDLEARDPAKLGRDEAFAYWVNLYNAATVDLILDAYPVKSILRLTSGLRPGPWRRKSLSVDGSRLSLNNIEHDILRTYFEDNRVHYALNCASIGCPNLMNRAFVSASLDDDLETAARQFINHPRGVRIDRDRVVASSIYKWFREDFGGDEEGVLQHLRDYADPDLAAALARYSSIDDYDYDWRLNEASREKPANASARDGARSD